MKRMLSILLMLMLVPCAALAEEEDEPVTPMYELTMAHGFRFGGALSYMQLWDTNYLNFLKTHCNSITATNEMKAYSLLDQSKSRASSDGMPRMNFSAADKMVAWAQENGLGVRGHVLVWDAYMTPWFFHEQYDAGKPLVSREVMLQRLESYITQVITHFEEKFPGVVYCWDVVNEAVGEGSEFDPTDPRHIRTTRSGVTTCSFTLAVERDHKDKDGNRVTDYITVIAWRNTADLCCRYLTKGRQAAVIGSWHNRSYEDKDGNRRKAVEITVDSVHFCDSKKDGGQSSGSDFADPGYSEGSSDFTEIEGDGDLPF